ncbi:hypothetical protein [Sphingomonas sp.]|uniref:hypothetical protein n=1 Tax=Sphingomonas sp. TaxID=28214 RepID=UPI002B9C4445|nr:hypothetical protein [Sphingomonas sp.]HWK36524.1 hypothetical protein [Sphingomonas sp.]
MQNTTDESGAGAVSNVLARVRGYLKETGMAATQFGRAAANDPRLVGDLANGREPRARMVARIDAYIATQRETKR